MLGEERDFQRAAARLFVTPSAVSHALARLRQALADPLFVRSGAQLVVKSFERRSYEVDLASGEADVVLSVLAREGRQRPIVVSVPGYGAVGDLLRATSLVATMPGLGHPVEPSGPLSRSHHANC